MKRISLLLMSGVFSLVSCSQDIPAAKVPSVVQNTVKLKFPNATDIEWEKKKDSYEAEFNISNIEHCLHIDNAGIVLLHKQEINETELPVAVISAIQKNYNGYKIDDAKKVDKKGVICYEVELEAKGKKDVQAFFSPSGDITNI